MSKKSRLLLIIVFLAIGTLAGWLTIRPDANEMPAQPSDEAMSEELTGRSVEYAEGVIGHLALPEGEGPFPALVLIHEWWGLNDNIRRFAEDFAEQGYVALAVDLYDGEVATTPDRARELATSVRNDTAAAFENLASAVSLLKARKDVLQNSLASVGWCFGGGWSYEMAKNDLDVDASVIYYGRFNPEDDLSIMRAKILGHFGEDDVSISTEDVRSLEANLQTLDDEHQIFIYPHAGHAFANEDNELSYVPEAANLSWQRTLDFLARMLKR